MADKRIFIIAGPNGAGKTTLARELLPQEADCPIFVNADLIAEGLSPFHPDVAAVRSGRVMLSEIRRHAARRAHEIALESGTKIIIVVDGKTVAIDPDPERFDSPAPRSR